MDIELLTFLTSSTVQGIRTKAQRAFGRQYLQQQEVPLPCRVKETAQSLPGVVKTKDYDGDSSAGRDQLKGSQQIQATEAAFAAILADGSVVTWSDEGGGDMFGPST